MGRPTVVITVEGVIQKLNSIAPIPQGRALYKSLAETHNIILASNYDERESLEDWLKGEGLTSHSKLFTPGDVPSWHKQAPLHQVMLVKYLARVSNDIHFVIDPDPAVVAALNKEGFPTLLCSFPAYAYSEWRPDAQMAVRPWDELVTALDEQRRLRADDARLKEIEEDA